MKRWIALIGGIGVMALMVGTPAALAGGGCHAGPDIRMTTSAKALVGIGQCAFIDTVVYIEPGDEVRWVNKDAVPHTVTGAANSWGDETFMSRGQSVTHSFEEKGVYPYYCALHPSMVGAVVVGDGVAPAALAPPEPGTTPQPPMSSGSAAVIGLAIVATLGLVTLVARVTRSRGTFPDGASGSTAPSTTR